MKFEGINCCENGGRAAGGKRIILLLELFYSQLKCLSRVSAGKTKSLSSCLLAFQEGFSEDCKFRERFQENSYNTYASVIHRNHRTGREWYVALNKRGKAKMGSSPRVKSQHVSTHFLPRVSLHDRSQLGFTITDRSKDRRKSLPLTPPQPSPAKANTHAGTTPRRTQVKYWPKYRFG